MRFGVKTRHNVDMSEMPHDEKPALEEDAKLARILGLVLFCAVPVFGFYYGSVFGKTGPVDGKIWFYDYRLADLMPSLYGALIGFVIALVMNAVIWFYYKKQTDEDLIHEWYEPQAHKSSHH